MNPLKDNLHGFNSSVDNRPPKRRKFIHALHSVSVESLPDWDSPLIGVNNPLPGPSYWPQSNQSPPGRTEILDRRGSTSQEPHIVSVEDGKGPSAAKPSSPSLSSHQTPPLEIFPDKVYPSSGFLNAQQLDKLDLNAKMTSQPSKVKNLGIPKTIQFKAVQQNFRNASISSKSSQSQWRDPATPIPIPSYKMNPFNGGRFKDNSRQLKSSSGTQKNQRTPTDCPAECQKTTKPLLQPDISYVKIDSDEGDQPVAGPSLYQSAFKQAPASRVEVWKGRRSTGKEPVPISSEEEDVQASVFPDGLHSRWLEENLKPKPSSLSHSSQTSIIDDFSEPVLKESLKQGFVRAQVKKIKGKQVNLSNVDVRNGMKPKYQPLLKNQFNTVETHADPIATAPTTLLCKGFKSLPLKALYIGYNHLEGGYLLDFKPPPNRQTPLRHFTIIQWCQKLTEQHVYPYSKHLTVSKKL
ncbi:hypothetical protein BT96DRAFT_981574 [Gymnopus androsaceus JB14]|uniref:Uncharacterized protein n=1 Tax=Gymnopus androsaceus JB14 TaxID=1447944 RepID=A0A6A4GNZ1_9AGAR|nr:hypothetical protein BT96DRAFT_981574 [Gymnopus androsaceus JB14]